MGSSIAAKDIHEEQWAKEEKSDEVTVQHSRPKSDLFPS